MKVISISTDRKIFEENSDVSKRIIQYGELFDELHVILFFKSETNSKIQISKNVWIYPTNSKNRLFYISDAFRIVNKIFRISNFEFRASRDWVVSVQDPFETGIVGLLLKLRYKLPLQIQLHTDFANRHFITHSFLNLIRFPLGLFILSFADSVRTVSERVARSVKSLAPNVSVLPIMTSPPAPLLAKERGERDGINFLTVARLEKEKDLATAIRAFKKVLDADIKSTFTIVGDGNEKNNLGRLAKSLGIADKINFVGWQSWESLQNYYQTADVYISTSLYEGYGLSSVEAAFAGLPLILSDTGLAGFDFNDESEALVCRQRDVSGFAKAMIKMASDKNLRERMGVSAMVSVERSAITKEQYLDRYKNSLGQAVARNSSREGIFEKNILLRYLAAGITGASSQIFSLYVFTDVLNIWYIYSSILSFMIAISISFVLQKFWTFADKKIDKVHAQFVRYLGVGVLGITLNTFFMYTLVDLFGLWYIFAQIITGAIIAIFNFLMYKFFIFHK